MNQPLVSCIVPVYNVEKYLNQCIESIVNQTYKNIEIILIDDGSTDTSPEICDTWEKKDERIIVIHKKNGGISSARNEGLNQRKGKWIVFIDSDDYVHPQFIELLWKGVSSHNTLVACCLYNKFQDNEEGEINNSNCLLEEKSSLVEMKKNYYEMLEDLVIMSWNKIYHYSILEQFSFYNGKVCEDIGLLFFLIGKLETFSKVSYPLYYYRKNEEGITETYLKGMSQLDMIDVIMKEYYFFLNNDEKYARLILTTCIDFFPSLYDKLKKNRTLNKGEFLKKYKEIYRELCRIGKFKKKIVWKHKIYIKFPFLIDMVRKNINNNG